MAGEAYESLLQELEAERAELDSLIAFIRRRLGKTDAIPASPVEVGSFQSSNPVMQSRTAGTLSSDAFFGLSLVDAAQKYLAHMKTPKTAREIADALLSGGFKTTSKDFYNTVFSVLSREDKNQGAIAKVNREFGLSEWYPGLKRTKTQSKNMATIPLSMDSDDTTDPPL